MKKNAWFGPVGAAMLALVLLAACGDDDDDSNGDTGGSGGTDAVAGSGGTQAGGSGGNGAAGETGGSGGTQAGGSGGTGFPMDGGFPFGADCSEDAPTDPVVCGGETCTVESSSSFFGGAGCVYPCCFSQNGSEVCGARDTTVDDEVACQPPPEADTRCPDFSAAGAFGVDAGGMGTVYEGCCTPDNKCGIISSIRPLCITTSQYLDLPETPQACDAN